MHLLPVLFVSLVLLVAAAKKAKSALGICGASRGHITKIEQSIFFRYLWRTHIVSNTPVKQLCSLNQVYSMIPFIKLFEYLHEM